MSHFKITEFSCKDGCGLNSPAQELIQRLEIARTRADIPFIIESACRCQKHNAKVGGKDNSAHLPNASGLCEAVDILVTTSNERFKILESLFHAGFERVGIGNTFLHCDVSKTNPVKCVWLYPTKE